MTSRRLRFDDYRHDVEFLDSNESFKAIFLKLDSFPPPPPIALSVVSIEVFAPHKMAEIRARHSNEGVPDPRIGYHTLPARLIICFFGGNIVCKCLFSSFQNI